jgi:Patatin-like phospholipase
MEFPRIGVITIQGGGAVAIDLIGQLQGLTGRPQDDNGRPTRDQGLLPAAVAGTSAGAIIATLYWAGYSLEAIRDKVVHLFAPSRVNNFFGLGGGLLPVRFNGFTALAAAASAFLRGPKPFLAHLVCPGRRWWLTPVWWIWQAISLPLRFLATFCASFNSAGSSQATAWFERSTGCCATALCFSRTKRHCRPTAYSVSTT